MAIRDEIDFSDEEQWLFFLLIGERPTDALYNLGYHSHELFEHLATDILNLRETITQSVADAQGALPTQVTDSYVQAMSTLTGATGGTDHLRQFADQLHLIAAGQIEQSQQIMKAKIDMIFELGMLLLELAFITATAYFTGGLSLTQTALAQARTRLTLLMIIHQLLGRLHILPGITEALQEGLLEFAAQLTMLTVNTGERRPDGIDWTDIGKSVFAGLLTGSLISLLNTPAPFLKNLIDDHADTWGGKLLAEGTENLWNAGAEGFGEGLGEYLTQGLLDGEWDWNWNTVAGGTASSLITNPAFDTAHLAGLNLHHKWHTTTNFT
ncbi:hypothetical protein QC029_30410, partial [Streptomyces sp. DH37]|nr:hypothetical protein [Streptomyces sp. DH37]